MVSGWNSLKCVLLCLLSLQAISSGIVAFTQGLARLTTPFWGMCPNNLGVITVTLSHNEHTSSLFMIM